jgi:alkylation response protein AidB-like acyl-CoA dehydrogenase
VDGRARHGARSPLLAVPLRGAGLGLGQPTSDPFPESTIDGSGTVRLEVSLGGELEQVAAAACWRAWSAATLAYLAGLAERALELAVEHARTREQFGAPLGALPAVRALLADAVLAVDSLRLLAWASGADDRSLPVHELLWAGSACCDVTAAAHQVHGAIGFALETGLHRYYRRARALHEWTAAACRAAR